MWKYKGFMLATTALLGAIAQPAIAATTLTITNDTPSFKDKTLSSGAIKVVASYQPINYSGEPITDNLHYRIYYNNTQKVDVKVLTASVGNIMLKDLDRNGTPEVIVSAFSGGAHCCTETTIYTWQNNTFTKAETGPLDGLGGEFKDLNQDGIMELVTFDPAFLYSFSSYAGSFPPSRIYRLRNGKLENTTRQHPKELRAVAWQMFQAIKNRQKSSEVNGVLAGYVAQKILLGEFEQGWTFMLTHYNRRDRWGLDEYKDDRTVPKYSNFPAALKAFLIKQGYLNQAGQPIR